MAKKVTTAPMGSVADEVGEVAERQRSSRGGSKSEKGLSAFELVTNLEGTLWVGHNDYERGCWARLRGDAANGVEPDKSNGALNAFMRCLFLRLAGSIAVSDTAAQKATWEPLFDAKHVKGFWGIVHDKDSRRVFSNEAQDYVTEAKQDHIHLLATFSTQDPRTTVSAVAEVLGIPENQINKPKRGRYAVDNMTAYLMHAASPGKHLYDPQEVVTLRECPGLSFDGFNGDNDNYAHSLAVFLPECDYQRVYAVNAERWAKARAKNAAKKKVSDGDVDLLYARCVKGELSKDNILLSDDLYETYSANSRRIDEGLRIAAERRAAIALDALKRGEFKCEVIFITGEPGTGKSVAAFHLAEAMVEVSRDAGRQPWRIYTAAATNCMDNYMGEEVVVMDDVRGSSMSASDWLKMLDPYNSARHQISARYKNVRMAARVIIITCYKEPTTFFAYTKQIGGGDKSEAIDQFLRRLSACVRVVKPDDVNELLELRKVYQVGRTVQLDSPRQVTLDGSGAHGDTSALVSYGFDYANAPMLNETEALCEMLSLISEGSPELGEAVARYSLARGYDRKALFAALREEQNAALAAEIQLEELETLRAEISQIKIEGFLQDEYPAYVGAYLDAVVAADNERGRSPGMALCRLMADPGAESDTFREAVYAWGRVYDMSERDSWAWYESRLKQRKIVVDDVYSFEWDWRAEKIVPRQVDVCRLYPEHFAADFGWA